MTISIKKTAFMFPGQGSQSLGVFTDFVDHIPFMQSVFKTASIQVGYDTWELMQKGPVETLNQTVYTQPILLIASVALWRLWQLEDGLLPDFFVGHSLGEYTAYTCAESFLFEEAVQLVAQRGAYMQDAVSDIQGAMAVIVGLSKEAIEAICQQVNKTGVVAPSNYNTDHQIIISGQCEAVEHVMHIAKSKGVYLAKRLPISVPSHCTLMKSATLSLADALEHTACRTPFIPVVGNVYSQPFSDPMDIKQSLVKQLYQPVHWMKNIQYLLAQGVNCFIECGPGRVLTNLVKQIATDPVYTISIGTYTQFKRALSECKESDFH